MEPTPDVGLDTLMRNTVLSYCRYNTDSKYNTKSLELYNYIINMKYLFLVS